MDVPETGSCLCDVNAEADTPVINDDHRSLRAGGLLTTGCDRSSLVVPGRQVSDFIQHQRGFPTPDLDGLKRGISSLRRSIPDINLEVADTIVEDDKICFILRSEGTHRGPFGPIPASGTHLTLEVIDICRFRDGKIIEHWGIPDRMSIMEQIGMPQPPAWLMKLLMKVRRGSNTR